WQLRNAFRISEIRLGTRKSLSDLRNSVGTSQIQFRIPKAEWELPNPFPGIRSLPKKITAPAFARAELPESAAFFRGGRTHRGLLQLLLLLRQVRSTVSIPLPERTRLKTTNASYRAYRRPLFVSLILLREQRSKLLTAVAAA